MCPLRREAQRAPPALAGEVGPGCRAPERAVPQGRRAQGGLACKDPHPPVILCVFVP